MTATTPPRTGPAHVDAPASPVLDVPLSVLDVASVTKDSTPAQALAEAMELAELVDRLGYRRLWYAEHHNMPGIASSAPEVLIATAAARTTRIRVGSGGVMLPNHAPLMVAERFGTLEALHPGRIDLGIGRAPGTDPRTSRALRRDSGQRGGTASTSSPPTSQTRASSSSPHSNRIAPTEGCAGRPNGRAPLSRGSSRTGPCGK